jgi:hypothetical protein
MEAALGCCHMSSFDKRKTPVISLLSELCRLEVPAEARQQLMNLFISRRASGELLTLERFLIEVKEGLKNAKKN